MAKINILGTEYNLRYDYNAICDIEETFNLGIGQIFAEEQTGMRTIRVLLWAGIKHNLKGITVQKVGSLINSHIQNGGTIEEIMNKCLQGLQESGIMGGNGSENNNSGEQ